MTLYTPKRADQILDELRADIVDRAGFEIDFSQDEALGLLTAAIASVLADQDGRLGILAANTDPETAVDDGLDNLARITGVERKAATRSRYTVRAVSSDTTRILAAGSILEGGGTDDLQRWSVVADTSITTAETQVVIEAADAGPITLPSSGTTDLRKVTPAPNITVNYDPTDGDSFTIGNARQTDGELRVARRSRLASPASASEPGILSAVFAAGSWVEAVAVTESTSGITVRIVPEPVGNDRKIAVASAIFKAKAFGVATLGTVSVTVTNPDGVTTHTVRYSVGTTQAVAVAVAGLSVATGFAVDDVKAEITSSIRDLFSNLTVGDPVYFVKASAAFGRVPGVIGGSLTLDGGASDVSPSVGTTLLILSGDAVTFS